MNPAITSMQQVLGPALTLIAALVIHNSSRRTRRDLLIVSIALVSLAASFAVLLPPLALAPPLIIALVGVVCVISGCYVILRGAWLTLRAILRALVAE